MRFRAGLRRDHPELNLIAFIDVLLVILIFLMVSTSFTRFSALQVRLPTAASTEQLKHSRVITVAVDANGRYALGSSGITHDLQSLASALQQAADGNPEVVVEIHADAMATHQSVIQLMEAARLAGLPRLVFATRSDGGQR